MDRFGVLPQDGSQLRFNQFTKEEALEQGVYTDSTPTDDVDDPFAKQAIEETIQAQTFRKIWDLEDARFTPIREKLRKAWQQYHMSWDITMDADQTDRRYPLVMIYVERIAAAMMSMINFKGRWLNIQSTIPQHQVMMNVAKNLSNDLLKHTDTKFVQKIGEAFKYGIMGGQFITQVLPSRNNVASATGEAADTTEENLNGFLESFKDLGIENDKPITPNPLLPKIELVNIPLEKVRLDSSGNNRYWMWTQEYPIGTVFAEAEARGYNVEEIKMARDRKTWAKPSDTTTSTELAHEGLGIDTKPPKGMMRLHFFEGTMDDPETGLNLFTNKLCVMANGCRILLLADIPFWDGERSAVISKFIDPPGVVYGKGLVTENTDPFDVRNGMTNLLLDFIRRVLNPPYEENVDLLDPEEVRKPRKFFPGAIIKKQDAAPGAMVYNPVMPPEMPQSFWNTYQALDLQSQSTGGLDTGIGGALRTRGRQSAEEYKSRAAQQGDMFGNIFLLIEQSFLSPLVKLIYLRHLQYVTDSTWAAWVKANKKKFLDGTNKSDPKVLDAWDKVFDEMATWDAVKRFKFFGSNWSFNVEVFTQHFERQGQIENVFFGLKNLASVPGAIQQMRLNNWIRKGVEAFGWDPEEMLLPEVLSPPDLEGITIPEQDDSPMETPDLSRGGMGVLQSVAQDASQPPTPGSIFPGGPRQPMPNQVTPPM